MKTLSTPTASTRKGITSAMIRVTLTPRSEKRPTEDETAMRTITIPKSPSENFELTESMVGIADSVGRGGGRESGDAFVIRISTGR